MRPFRSHRAHAASPAFTLGALRDGSGDGSAPAGPSCRQLRWAIGHDELAMWFQPVVDLETGVLCGFEALVRWPHPELGLLTPASFVPMAETCGLSNALDEWVLMAACKQLALWQEDVLVGPGFRVAINISSTQLDGHRLVDRMADIIDYTGVEPTGLGIELTETSNLGDLDAARQGALGLRELGIELALDDFGSAYATFARLNAIPFDVLKLDRGLVQSIESPTGAAFARAAVELGRHLGCRVIAEGIETQARAEDMRQLGCHQGQGHLWSRALPAMLAERLLVSGAWPTGHPSVMGVTADQWRN